MSQNSLIYLVDDEAHILESLQGSLSKNGFQVKSFESGREALKSLKQNSPQVIITDILMPDLSGIDLIKEIRKRGLEMSCVVITAHASVDTAVQALRLGAVDYLIKPFRMDELVTCVKKALYQTRLVPDAGAQKAIQNRYKMANLLSDDPRMKTIFQSVGRIARTNSTVLITGESGTGKELIARSIHFNSDRKDKPFVSINCAALPENLLESELFGYEKGAFTGAFAAKQGLFEVADSGTFFLDEVGELPVSLQAKLLRVLQERQIKHIGGIKDIPIDVRLISATGRDLSQEIKAGRFREDLYYRLHVVPIHLPPLRDRKNDIPLLAQYFLKHYSEQYEVNKEFSITKDAMDALKDYDWPGNIRELENLTERIIATHDDDQVTADSISKLLTSSAQAKSKQLSNAGFSGKLNDAVEQLEIDLIEKALSQAAGNKFQAARHLGITRQALRYKLKKYKIGKGGVGA